MPGTPTEQPEDKALQDHTFGRTVARKTEEAEELASEGYVPPAARAPGTDEEGREREPHAGGRA
jgi:hypothetical protein